MMSMGRPLGVVVLLALGGCGSNEERAERTASAVQAARTTTATDTVVVNGTDNPVPTQAVGTTAVAGSVSIAGVPNVNVANPVTVNVAAGGNTVRVGNTDADAVPVRDVGRVGMTHVGVPVNRLVNLYGYLSHDSVIRSLTQVGTTTPFVVPAGYNLVVTDLQVRPNTNVFDVNDHFRVSFGFGAGSGSYVMGFTGTNTQRESFTTGFVVNTGAGVSGANGGTQDVIVTVLGYLTENTPS